MSELERAQCRAEIARRAGTKVLHLAVSTEPVSEELVIRAAEWFQRAKAADREAERAYNAELIAALQ